MKLDTYQNQARKYSVLENDADRIAYGLLNMAGEVGEITSKHAKAIRDKTPVDKSDLEKELGDLLWSICAYADGMGFSLEDVAKINLAKLRSRQRRNVIAGSGDDR